MLLLLILLVAALLITVESKCVEFSNEIVLTKAITDYTTYYTTLSRGAITMQVKEAPKYYVSLARVQVVPEDGDITAYDSFSFGPGYQITLVAAAPANLKFRLQVQVGRTGDSSTGSNIFAGTLCYPTESAASPPSETTTDHTNSPSTATTSTPSPTASISGGSSSSSAGKTATIAASIVGALLGAIGLTYLCKKCSVKFCYEEAHYHNAGSAS